MDWENGLQSAVWATKCNRITKRDGTRGVQKFVL